MWSSSPLCPSKFIIIFLPWSSPMLFHFILHMPIQKHHTVPLPPSSSPPEAHLCSSISNTIYSWNIPEVFICIMMLFTTPITLHFCHPPHESLLSSSTYTIIFFSWNNPLPLHHNNPLLYHPHAASPPTATSFLGPPLYYLIWESPFSIDCPINFGYLFFIFFSLLNKLHVLWKGISHVLLIVFVCLFQKQ